MSLENRNLRLSSFGAEIWCFSSQHVCKEWLFELALSLAWAGHQVSCTILCKNKCYISKFSRFQASFKQVEWNVLSLHLSWCWCILYYILYFSVKVGLDETCPYSGCMRECVGFTEYIICFFSELELSIHYLLFTEAQQRSVFTWRKCAEC